VVSRPARGGAQRGAAARRACGRFFVAVGAACAWAAPQLAPADAALGPLAVRRVVGGPLVAVREQPEAAVVAVRLAVPVLEPAGLEGAARVLQELARERLEREAARFGARVALARTPTHAVYAVAGPADAFGPLIAALRRALGPPEPAASGLERARVAVRLQWTAELEVP